MIARRAAKPARVWAINLDGADRPGLDVAAVAHGRQLEGARPRGQSGSRRVRIEAVDLIHHQADLIGEIIVVVGLTLEDQHPVGGSSISSKPSGMGLS